MMNEQDDRIVIARDANGKPLVWRREQYGLGWEWDHAALAECVERLQAIVDKLPKTADGVPVSCGDTVYHIDRGEASSSNAVYPLEVQQIRGILLVGVSRGYRIINNYHAIDERCYSTQAAAEAARREGGGE